MRRLEAVTAGEVAELADALLAPERLSVAGIGPDESRFREAVERVNPALLVEGGVMRVALFGAGGKVGVACSAALAAGGARGRRRAARRAGGLRRGGRLHAPGRGRRERRARASRPACPS